MNVQSDLLFSDYYRVNRGDSDVKIFGYDARHAAILTKKENNYFITIQKVNGFQRSNPIQILPSNYSIFACFHHNGKDYLWYKENNSHYMSKIFSPPNFEKTLSIEFDLLSYDHLRGDVLFTKNKTISIYPFSYFLSRNATVLANRNFRTNLSCSDIIFVDGKIYCTNDFTIYKIPIPNGIGKWLANYYINRFQFALFPKRLSTMSICQVSMGSSNYLLETFLYIIDFLIIIILIYLLRDKIKEASPNDILRFRRPRNHINIEQELMEIDALNTKNLSKNDTG